MIRALTTQLQAAKRAHRRETDQLRQQLAAATGEIIVLRQRIHNLQAGTASDPEGA